MDNRGSNVERLPAERGATPAAVRASGVATVEEREQAFLRQQLSVVRARVNAILKSAPHGVHFVEAGTERVFGNLRAFELMGQASVPTLSDYNGEVFTPDGKLLPRKDWPARRVLRGETFSTQELLVRTPDDREVPVLISAAPIRGVDGHIEGVVLAYEDISALKDLQRMRDEWASIIAHDLRQPLNVIASYVSVLQSIAEKPDLAMLDKGLAHMKRAANSINRMVGDLADVSRIEAKRLPLDRRPVDLDELVREVVERHQAVSRGRVIELRVDGPLAKVNADAVRIEQVVSNLLANALKYSDAGSAVKVAVREKKDELRVLVTNAGRPISATDIPRLFDRYFRTTEAHAGATNGLGVGLYIARGLTEAHGGRIWAENDPGGTITFQFALPVYREALLH